jgi:transcriptional regulator with XRE-family HTH domain
VDAGLTQASLAECAGLSVRGTADLERGVRRFPYAEPLERLVEALDLNVAERAALIASARRKRVPNARVDGMFTRTARGGRLGDLRRLEPEAATAQDRVDVHRCSHR